MDESEIPKFNRSFTRSEPNLLNCRQVSVTEYFHQLGADHQLIRQYSFRELRGNTEDCGRCTDQFLIPAIRSYSNSQHRENFTFNEANNFTKSSGVLVSCDDADFKNEDHFEETMQEHNYSPMDIDQSESKVDMDVSMKETSWAGKKLSIKSSETTKENKNETPIMDRKQIPITRISFINVVFILCVAIVIAFLFFNNNVSLKDVSTIDVEKDLNLHVFNQNHILDVLLRNLNNIHTSIDFKKLLILVGTTGVGKTHLLNRIQANYPDGLFISLNYLVDKNTIDHKKNISFPKHCFILSIDDLKIEQVPIVASYIKSLSHNCMLIIPVFNIQETGEGLNHFVRYDHFKQIAEYFSDNFGSSETLLFNTMNRKHLETWLQMLIESRGIDVEQHRNIIESLLENHDVDSYGFKGVTSKINLLS